MNFTFLLIFVVANSDSVVLFRRSIRLLDFKSLVEMSLTASKLRDSYPFESPIFPCTEVPARGSNSVFRPSIRFLNPVYCVSGLLVTV